MPAVQLLVDRRYVWPETLSKRAGKRTSPGILSKKKRAEAFDFRGMHITLPFGGKRLNNVL